MTDQMMVGRERCLLKSGNQAHNHENVPNQESNRASRGQYHRNRGSVSSEFKNLVYFANVPNNKRSSGHRVELSPCLSN